MSSIKRNIFFCYIGQNFIAGRIGAADDVYDDDDGDNFFYCLVKPSELQTHYQDNVDMKTEWYKMPYHRQLIVISAQNSINFFLSKCEKNAQEEKRRKTFGKNTFFIKCVKR